MAREPARRGRGHRRVQAARRHTDDDAEQQLEPAERGRLAGRDQTQPEQRATGQDHRARAEPVGQRPPGEGAGAHRQEVEERGGGDAGA